MRPRPQAILSVAVPCVVLLVLLLLVSCTIAVTPPAPAVAPTEPAGYVHYVPRPGSPFEIEFDYPAAWYLGGDEENRLSGLLIAELASARPTSTPTPSDLLGRIFEHHVIYEHDSVDDSEPGMVILLVKDIDPATFSLNKEVEQYVEGTTRLGDQLTLESRPATEIDGYPALRVTEVWAASYTGVLTPQRVEWVFLAAGSRYYSIRLRTPEHFRDGPFAKGFEYLVSSIRIMR